MLKRVGINLSTLPLRHMGGALSGTRQLRNRGERMNQSVGQGISSKLAAIPSGHLAPSAWVLPYKGGDMASRGLIIGDGDIVAALTSAKAISALLSGEGGISSAAVSQIIQLLATLTGSGNISEADAKAFLLMTALITASGGATATATGRGAMAALMTGEGSVDALISGLGELEAIIRGYGDLTPEGLRDAVWSALTANYTTAGTMGKALQDASAAGNPWAALLAANNDPNTFGELMQTMQTLLDEMHKIAGLDAANPMTVTTTNRTSGSINLNITGDGSTTTTVTRA